MGRGGRNSGGERERGREEEKRKRNKEGEGREEIEEMGRKQEEAQKSFREREMKKVRWRASKCGWTWECGSVFGFRFRVVQRASWWGQPRGGTVVVPG